MSHYQKFDSPVQQNERDKCSIQESIIPKTQQLLSNRELLYNILRVGVPASVASSSQILIEIINLVFIGHLGNAQMVAGVGLGNMYINATAVAVFVGLNNAIATFVSQLNGSGKLELCGEYLNRGRIVTFFSFFIIFPLLLMADSFFLQMNMDKETSKFAQDYIKVVMPGLVLQAEFDIVRTFLNCFGKSQVAMTIQIVTTSLHVLWSYIFVSRLQLGLTGTAISTIITFSLNVVTITIYMSYFEKELKDAWFLPTKNSFKNLGQYIQVAFPSMLMLCLEWWTFEIQTFFASFISIEATGSQVIILNVLYLLFTMTLGLQVAGYSLIGQAIGSQNIILAKGYRQMIFIIGLVLTLFQSTFIYTMREQLAVFFTDIEELRVLIVSTLQIVAFVQLVDCTQGWLQGIIRGLGRFREATFGVIVSLYGLCLPFSWFFGIHLKYGLQGLWMGMFIGLFVIAAFFIYLVTIKLNWHQISIEVNERSEQDNQQLNIQQQKLKENLLTQKQIDEQKYQQEYQNL